MDVLSVLSSINKISLIAFLCVFAALVYELVLLKRGHKRRGKPSIPKFNTNAQAQADIAKPVVAQVEKKKGISSARLGLVFVLILLVVLGGSIFIISRALQENNDTSNSTIQPLRTRASDVSTTPSGQTFIQTTSTPTPIPTEAETEPTPTDTLLALNISPTVSVSPTEIPIPTELEPTEDTEESTIAAQVTTVATTTSSSLPISGNTNFTLMAIAISGIIVLVSFVF